MSASVRKVQPRCKIICCNQLSRKPGGEHTLLCSALLYSTAAGTEDWGVVGKIHLLHGSWQAWPGRQVFNLGWIIMTLINTSFHHQMLHFVLCFCCTFLAEQTLLSTLGCTLTWPASLFPLSLPGTARLSCWFDFLQTCTFAGAESSNPCQVTVAVAVAPYRGRIGAWVRVWLQLWAMAELY